MKYEWEADGYEKVSASPRAPQPQRLSSRHDDPVQVKRIGSSAQA
jgi:hypothetical protein